MPAEEDAGPTIVSAPAEAEAEARVDDDDSPEAPGERPWGGFALRTAAERVSGLDDDQGNARRRKPLPPLIRTDLPTEHPVIVDVGGVEVVALDVGPGAERGTVLVRWRTGNTWSPRAEEVVRDSILRDATEDEVEHGAGFGLNDETDPSVTDEDAAATG
ncbi:MAG TPA: hypothetical protein VHG72_14015 [Polyangia bacterium]|nr:hypothetical protein [Polyangia bacterium]